MRVIHRAVATFALFTVAVVSSAQSIPPVPEVPREFRAAWCATVDRIDWPVVAGQSYSHSNQQKQHLIQHLDALKAANLNTMYFQVRPACDAMYKSSIEPWSVWLTGAQGHGPLDPNYDPLAFAVQQAHLRGIELYAWINPYRVTTNLSTSNLHSSHIYNTHRHLCVRHGNRYYLDPGRQETIDRVTSVIADIVTRYDVDGVVFDDYFYPGTDFDDDDTFAAYLAGGGTITDIHDWRRDNVDRLIESTYNTIHSIRNECHFAVGPFGIWRPDNPPGIAGADYYATHYCDTRKWLQNNWVDSLSPQLYWPTDSPGQPFEPLINWWAAQNPDRHVLASTAPYRIGNSAYDTWGNMWSDKTYQELLDQVDMTRNAGGVGNVHYSMRWLTNNHAGITTALKNGPYAEQALRPTAPWLDNTPPPMPVSSISPPAGGSGNRTITFSQSPGDEAARWWVVHTYNGSEWDTKVLPAHNSNITVPGPVIEYAVVAVDRTGNESPPSTLTSVANWTLY